MLFKYLRHENLKFKLPLKFRYNKRLYLEIFQADLR
jgi:hypothetical protein